MTTNNLTEKITQLMVPCAALIVYKVDNKYYLETRFINDMGKMEEAMPVSYEFLNEIASNYSVKHNSTPFGNIPENLLYSDVRHGSETYIWYNKPGKRMMYFNSSLGIENGEYNLPGIIYKVKSDKLFVFAYLDDKLQDSTELYTAPFFNVSYPEGTVCLGSANIEEPTNPTFTDLLNYWEKKFWLTEFVHLGAGGNPTNNNLVLVTKACKNAPFDANELKNLKLTLKDLRK